MDKIKLELDLDDHGWATVTFGNSEENVTLYISYIFDGLERLLSAALLLNKGANSTECALFSEPGGYYLSFELTEGLIALKIYESERWNDMPLKDVIHQCKLILCSSCKLKQLNNQLNNAFHHLREKYDAEEYKRIWGNEFPATKLTELQHFISMV